MSEQAECCGNCKFWAPGVDGTNVPGWCQRYPPQIVQTVSFRGSHGDYITEYSHDFYIPPMHREGWCGEWKAKS